MRILGVTSYLFSHVRTVPIVYIREKVRKEVSDINDVLKANGYPAHIIKSAQRSKRRQEEEPKHTISLPYVSGLSENLRRVFRFDIRTVFDTISTLRQQQLAWVKDVDPPLIKACVVHMQGSLQLREGIYWRNQGSLRNPCERTSVSFQKRENRKICNSGTCLG